MPRRRTDRRAETGGRVMLSGRSAALRLLLGLAVCLVPAAAPAQDDAGDGEKRELVVGKWYPMLETGLNLTQSAYSDNWAGGDKGSIVWTWILNATLENQIDPKVNWYNMLKLAYGQTHQQSVDPEGERRWDEPEKSTDLIDYETIFRFTLGGFVDPFASGRFESQFQDASDPFGRTLALNPLKFKESAGIAKMFFDEEDRSLLSRLGFSFRQSVRRQFESDPPEDATTSETANDGGIEWITDFKTRILNDRVAWTSKLGFYQPLFYSGKDELEDLTDSQLAAARLPDDVVDYTTTVDIDWENIFTTQITEVISVNLYTRWVYDKYENSVLPLLDDAGDVSNPGAVRGAIRKAGQFKQTLAIGITYRLL
ncbi:MAG: DUF3078 domain-containing protein [Candidatus Latescibacteria bacterium]|nr:DUF3078 domain-containing protein [Candidatus Latescibacterota bacterium]